MASPNPRHSHPLKVIQAKAPGIPQAAQHCIWPLGHHWDIRGPPHYLMRLEPWDRSNLVIEETYTTPRNKKHFFSFCHTGEIREARAVQEACGPPTVKQKKNLLINLLKRNHFFKAAFISTIA